jgi:uncharacterized membrane protein
MVHFPLAFLLAAPLLQLWHAVTGSVFAGQVSALALEAGLVMALPAATAGAYDAYVLIVRPKREAAYNTAMAHVMSMLCGLFLYVFSLICLRGAHEEASLVLSVFGGVLLALGGFFGGSLVYIFGIGVHKKE